MKNTLQLLLASGIVCFSATAMQAQVAVNNTAANPDASAILDLNTGNAGVNKGFLAPQVALTNVNTAAPVTSPATGLIVYSSAAPTGGNGKGYYYWTGTAWASLNSTLGGSGTNNYLARWTPNGSTLGIGLVQDNNAAVGINNAPVAGTMLTVTGGANNGINATTTYTLAGSSAVHGNDTVGIDGYLGYNGPLTVAGFSVTKAGGYFAGTAGTCAPFVASSSGTNPNVAVMGLSDNWHGGLFVTSYGAASGVIGYNDSASGHSGGSGVGGYSSQANGFGVYGQNMYAKSGVGPGVMGVGSGATASFFNDGEGIMGNGTNTGVEGYADSAAKNCAGGYFQNTASYAYIGFTLAATNYKINGNGNVSTIVKDQNDKNINLFCPEAPEILFQDYGQGQLANGKTHINLDPNYAKNVTINEKHPLRVIITMNDPCPNTIYVTNRTTTGFDVIENNNGVSNASFTYEVIANRADELNADGSVAKNADVRFPAGPGPKVIHKATNKKAALSNTKTPGVNQ